MKPKKDPKGGMWEPAAHTQKSETNQRKTIGKNPNKVENKAKPETEKRKAGKN